MVRLDLASLRDFAKPALDKCLEIPGRKSSRLETLSKINLILVSDRRIAQLHRRFMDEAGPTDVITFQHGEIVISAETAKRQARRFRTSVGHELRLYIVHGLLHLRGFDDKTAAGAAEMKQVQEKLIASLEPDLLCDSLNFMSGATQAGEGSID
jgi:probable rRNA maturation factor